MNDLTIRSVTSSTGEVTTDPLFVNPANADFTLQSNSPAINAGMNVGLTTDYIGNAVPSGSAPDIGAYEYTGGPSVTTSTASPIATTTATLNGSITSTGGINSTQSGFAWGTSSILSGGSIASFTTSACASTVTTQAASSVTATTATGNGTVTVTGGSSITMRGFAYGLTTAYGATTTDSGTYSTGAFTASITGLTCNTLYHYRAYSTNSAGTSYGADATFTTSACDTPTSTVTSTVIPTVTESSSPTISSSGSSSSQNATGFYITLLRALGLRPPLQTQVTPLAVVYTTPPSVLTESSFVFTKPLEQGATNTSVKYLQIFLNTNGFPVSQTGAGSNGHETNFFGPATRKAVERFQLKYKIAKPGDAGYGVFGPKTRAKINELGN